MVFKLIYASPDFQKSAATTCAKCTVYRDMEGGGIILTVPDTVIRTGSVLSLDREGGGSIWTLGLVGVKLMTQRHTLQLCIFHRLSSTSVCQAKPGDRTAHLPSSWRLQNIKDHSRN